MSRASSILVWVFLAVVATLALTLGITSAAAQTFIETSGANIPTNDVFTDYVWGVAWAVVLFLSIFAWPVSWAHKKMLAAAWLVKCFTALVLMLPYEERYYGLDCWYYFRSAHADAEQILESLLRGGADVIVAIAALQLKIGPDSYHAMKLTFAMIGLVGIFLFYRAAEQLLGKYAPVAFWILLLYPSILFWSSIFGKDPPVLAAIGLHVWGLANLAAHRKPKYLLAVVGGILAVSTIRIWMGPILILPCLLLIVSRIKSMGWRLVSLATIALALITLGSATMDRLSLNNASDLVEATRAVTNGWDNANSSLQRDVELNSSWDLLLFAPRGLFDTFFRPLPGDVDNLFGWMAGVENTVLLLLSAWAAFRFRPAYLRNPVFFWSMTLLLTWGLAYSIVAHRDLGTAVRFKLQILPILLGTIGYLLHHARTARLSHHSRLMRTAPYNPARTPA